MATEHSTTRAEALRARIDRLEREHAERIARANAALAAAQDKSYWLDRWHVDLNELMRKTRGQRGSGPAVRGAAVGLPRAVRRALEASRSRPLAASAHERWRVPRCVEERRARASRRATQLHRSGLGPDPLHARPRSPTCCSNVSVPADLDELEVEARRRARRPSGKPPMPTTAGAWRSRSALTTGCERCSATGLSTPRCRAAECTRWRAAPRPRAARLLRRPRARRRCASLASSRRPARRRSTSAAPPGGSCGCSPPRYPELDWHGCDPIPDAIEWARANLPGIALRAAAPSTRRFRTPTVAFDFVFAISIWCHFAEGAALDLAARDAPHHPAGRAARASPPTAHRAIVHTPARRACARPSSSSEIERFARPRRFLVRGRVRRAGRPRRRATPDWGTAF